MSKKLLSISVRGKSHTWTFDMLADPRYLDEWRADGLEIDEVVNVIPSWVVEIGMARAWCVCQDMFHWKWPA